MLGSLISVLVSSLILVVVDVSGCLVFSSRIASSLGCFVLIISVSVVLLVIVFSSGEACSLSFGLTDSSVLSVLLIEWFAKERVAMFMVCGRERLGYKGKFRVLGHYFTTKRWTSLSSFICR